MIEIPQPLFEGLARFTLEQAPHNDRAQGLYNSLVIALANQKADDGEAVDTAGIPAVE